MTIDISVLNLTTDANLASVTLECIDPTDWVLIDSVQSADGKTREAIYQLIGTDENYPAQVRIGVYQGTPKNGTPGNTNISVKLSTYVKQETDSVVDWILPATFTVASSVPGLSGVGDSADYVLALQNLLSVLTRTVDTGALQTVQVDKLKFGVPQII